MQGLGAARWLVLVCCAGCVDITLPACQVVSDCPPCAGWRTCQDGYCFKFGASAWDAALCGTCAASAQAVAGDGCCPGAALLAEGDSDCAVGAVNIEGVVHSSPVASRGEAFFVVVERSGGALSVVGATAGGLLFDTALKTTSVTRGMEVPALMANGDVLVATGVGLCRVSDQGALKWACDKGGPQTAAPLLLGDRIVAANQNRLVVLNTGAEPLGELELDAPITELVGMGDRYYALTTAGTLRAFEAAAATPKVVWERDYAPKTPLAARSPNQLVFGGAGGVLVVVRDDGATSNIVAQDYAGSVSSELVSNGSVAAATGLGGVALFELLDAPVALEVSEAPTDLVSPGLWISSGRVLFSGPGRVVALAKAGAGWKRVWAYNDASILGGGLGITQAGHVVARTQHGLRVLTPGFGSSPAGQWSRHRGGPAQTGYLSTD